MKLMWFHLMPYTELPDDFREKHPSVWVDIHSSLFDPRRAHHMYNDFMDELEFAAECGFDADRVEAAFGGEFELIHEVVVHVMRAPGIEQRRMDIDPHRRVLLPEIVGQLGIRHQMEPHQLHGGAPRNGVRKSSR